MNEYGITEYGIWNLKFEIWNMELKPMTMIDTGIVSFHNIT
jgi:hypothetical protein